MPRKTAAQRADEAAADKLAKMQTGAETNQPGPRTRGDSVTVACKLPHGLILRLFAFTEVSVPILGGGTRMEKKAFQIGESVTINGNAAPFGEQPRGDVVGGYALTPNVPADFWEKWLAQNHDSDAVRNGMIFAHGSREKAVGQAKEQKALKSGQERIDVRPGSKDPRLPKGVKTLSKTDDADDAAA